MGMLNMKNKTKGNCCLLTNNIQKGKRNKRKNMLVPHGKVIATTRKTKVVGEDVAVEIMQIVEVVEEATIINLVMTVMVQ